MLNSQSNIGAEQHLIFRLLVGYRWLSLLPPLIALIMLPQPLPVWRLLAFAASLTLILTLAARPINHRLLQQPRLLGLDLLISAVLVWYTGLEHSPYYLYSLAPILAAAFFFHIRGALLAAAGYTLLYITALLMPPTASASLSIPDVIGQIISFFLIGAIFGYPSILIPRLRQAHAELAGKNDELFKRNRNLDLMQELSLVMQSSVDPAELQEAIVRGLVHEMGYRRAIIGLYDEELGIATGWIAIENALSRDTGRAAQIAHTTLLPLKQDQGPLARALRDKRPLEIIDHEPPTTTSAMNRLLVVGPHYLILPLSLRGQAIGVILVDCLPPGQPLALPERLSLEHLATHAGVALGSLRLCIDRAQRLAIFEERQRIAADLHDNVSQALYGLAYGLEAAVQLMSREPALQNILTQLYTTVTEAQGQLRRTIFETKPDELTADMFVGGLHRHLRTISPVNTMDLRIDLSGDFDHWPADTRRQLYRVAQEALANSAKHANARQLTIKLNRNHQHIELHIADDGDGFDLAKTDSAQHLGLQNMTERIETLGGTLEINSALGEGTLIIITVPCTEAAAASSVLAPVAATP
jgi:signal transduction histidine kinase